MMQNGQAAEVSRVTNTTPWVYF